MKSVAIEPQPEPRLLQVGTAGDRELDPVREVAQGVGREVGLRDRADRRPQPSRAVAAEDWPTGGKALSQIRKLVGINTLIGIATLAVGAGGRWFGMA